jgi:hypothetical protein
MFVEAYQPCDTTPAHYVQYLRDTKRNAERILSEPVQNWPKGTSHDISRQIIDECAEHYENLVLDFGEFTAYGKLAGFARARASTS